MQARDGLKGGCRKLRGSKLRLTHLLWFGQELRLRDNESAAASSGGFRNACRDGNESFRSSSRCLFVMQVPAESARVSRMIVFALDNILRAAVEEPEDFIIQVQAVGVYLKTSG